MQRSVKYSETSNLPQHAKPSGWHSHFLTMQRAGAKKPPNRFMSSMLNVFFRLSPKNELILLRRLN